jgi:hypothetical protein
MDGGQAFPRPASPAHQHGMHEPQKGMTLRDYFAAKAMQGLMDAAMPMPEIAASAYAMADDMLKARMQ